MFANGVNLVYRGAAPEQRVGELLHVVEGDPIDWQIDEGGAAARDHSDNQVARPRALDELDYLPGAGKAGLVRYWMCGLTDLDDASGRHVAVLHVHDAVSDAITKNLLHRRGHSRACLATANDEDPLEIPQIVGAAGHVEDVPIEPEETLDCFSRVGSVQRCRENLEGRAPMLPSAASLE